MSDENKAPDSETERKNGDKNDKNDKGEKKKIPIPDTPPVVTQHQITLGGRQIEYTAAVGIQPLRDEDKDEVTAGIFYTAYTLNGIEDTSTRPLIFVFNGGPGSSSVWLHLGAIGPRRVRMHDEGWMPAPPFRLEDNANTWLELGDLVFIDPVGTGFSRAADPKKKKDFWGVEQDLKAVGDFIRLYLTHNKRWHSPLFLAGESYGTTRAAGLTGYLVDRGIAFNGIVLISTVLSYQTLSFEHNNDLPYVLFLPTYAATAWYHKKLPADLQAKSLDEVVSEVEAWAANEYTVILTKGDRLSADEHASAVEQLSRYTGLDARFIDYSNLRIRDQHFFKELLRDERRTTGRLDSRFRGLDRLNVTETPEFDPSYAAIIPPYTAMLNQYVRADLGYETDALYEILSSSVNQGWQWEAGKFPDTSEALRSALAKNPFMRVLLAMGYYDLATPHYTTEYTLSHLELDPTLHDNFQLRYYAAGHMLYLDVKSLAQFTEDVRGFIQGALSTNS